MRLLRQGSLLFELRQYIELQEQIADLRTNSPVLDRFLKAVETGHNWREVGDHMRWLINEIEQPRRPLVLGSFQPSQVESAVDRARSVSDGD